MKLVSSKFNVENTEENGIEIILLENHDFSEDIIPSSDIYSNYFEHKELCDVQDWTLPFKPKASFATLPLEIKEPNQDENDILISDKIAEKNLLRLSFESRNHLLVTPTKHNSSFENISIAEIDFEQRTSPCNDVIWLLPGKDCPRLPSFDN